MALSAPSHWLKAKGIREHTMDFTEYEDFKGIEIKGPLGMRLEWDSDLTQDDPEKLLGWKSVGRADEQGIGWVEFASAGSGETSPPEGGGTQVSVSLKFAPRGGRLGLAVARFPGDDPSAEVAGCLLEFKHLMENRVGN
jgi:uncharacterized membrane protein